MPDRWLAPGSQAACRVVLHREGGFPQPALQAAVRRFGSQAAESEQALARRAAATSAAGAPPRLSTSPDRGFAPVRTGTPRPLVSWSARWPP